MKKLVAALALLMVAATAAQAQSALFGVKGGVNSSIFSGDVNDAEPRISVHIGAAAELPFNEMNRFETGLYYTGYGSEAEDGTIYQFDYLAVPLLIKHFTGQEPNFHFFGGLEPGLLVKSDVEFDGMNFDASDIAEDFNLMLVLGLGYRFPQGIEIGLKLNFGLTNTLDVEALGGTSDMTAPTNATQLSIGYFFNQDY